MSRYDSPHNSETLKEEGAEEGVLENLLGIKTLAEIDEIETALYHRMRQESLESLDTEAPMNSETICELHRQWLGSLYSWAGRFRTVTISKPGFSWPPAAHVAQGMRALDEGLLASHTPCLPQPIQPLATAIALVHEEFLFIHPFREGNGRLARWLADIMALQAGCAPLDWTDFSSSEGRLRYYAAMGKAHAGRVDDLTSIILRALESGQALAASDRPQTP